MRILKYETRDMNSLILNSSVLDLLFFLLNTLLIA